MSKKEVIVVDDDGDDNAANISNKKQTEISSPQYILELAKSNRAECKRCCQKIEKSQLRVGVINEGEWGLFTKWYVKHVSFSSFILQSLIAFNILSPLNLRQHIHCTVFHNSVVEPAMLDGYLELPDDCKDLVDIRVAESKLEVDPDRIAVNPGKCLYNLFFKSLQPNG